MKKIDCGYMETLLDHITSQTYSGDPLIIDEIFFEEANMYHSFLNDEECLDEKAFFMGYEVIYDTEGDHRTDGQFVDYYFTFKSPEGVESFIHTEMCLMVGFNLHEDIEIG